MSIGRGMKRRSKQLISIKEAAAKGIERLRDPIWANQFDHIKIDIVKGAPGPWLHLYAPFNKECNGRDPVDFLGIYGPMKTDYESKSLEPYDGPLPGSDAYLAEVRKFSRK